MAYQGRLSDEFLGRFEDFSIRVLRLCMQLARDGRPRPIMDQLMRCGTSPGAQIAEAQEAMSTADFFRSIAIAVKELNETAYWLKLLVGMQWIPGERLHPLRTECRELRQMLKAMIARSKAARSAVKLRFPTPSGRGRGVRFPRERSLVCPAVSLTVSSRSVL